MPVIVVTRLRLRDPALMDGFSTDAIAAIERAMKSDGNLGAGALADANDAWWSVSAWQDRRLMQALAGREPRLGISARLDHYCDEATFVDWEQASPDLPKLADQPGPPDCRREGSRAHPPVGRKPDAGFPPPVQPPPSVS